MLIPHKCPVCEGTGQTPGVLGPGTLTGPVTCHACGGTGIIWGKGPDQPVKPPWGPRTPWGPWRYPYEVDPNTTAAPPGMGESVIFCFG
uniref:Putative chaperone n=1 Tax=viral metagenome TaxID=1070528 RepID=A0A6M3L751_9ZZZZ